MEQDQLNHVKGVIETLLFLSEKPITFDQIKKVLKTVNANEIKVALKSLSDEYQENKRGITLIEIADGYQMLTNPLYVSYAKEFYKTKHKEKLSKPALETLAIIAYKQPVTRMDIELIRGVNSDGVTSHLVNKELIKIVGRKDVAGKPFIYGTTRQFMEYFGLKSMDDLPKMEEFTRLAEEKQIEMVDSAAFEGAIPESTVPVNSLEAIKQNAITEEERNPDEGKRADVDNAHQEASEIEIETDQSTTATLEEDDQENENK